jgi:hypothetical protein
MDLMDHAWRMATNAWLRERQQRALRFGPKPEKPCAPRRKLLPQQVASAPMARQPDMQRYLEQFRIPVRFAARGEAARPSLPRRVSESPQSVHRRLLEGRAIAIIRQTVLLRRRVVSPKFGCVP